MSIVNPSQARKIFYQLLKDVNETHEPVYISGKKEESEAVMVSKKIGMLFKKRCTFNLPE